MARLIRIAPWAHDANHPEFAEMVEAVVAPPVVTNHETCPLETDTMATNEPLASRKIEAQARADECRRISRLLHDEVGQSLTAVTVKLAVLRGRTSGPVQAQLLDIHKLLEKTLGQVQHLSKDLHPSAVEDLGLLPALQSHIQSFSRDSAIVVRLKGDERLNDTAPRLAVAIFRSVQALLIDLRDAAARRAALTLAVDPDGAGLQLVAKARIGARGNAAHKFSDAATFHEQVLMAGGSVTFRSRRNEAVITARFPMTNHGKV